MALDQAIRAGKRNYPTNLRAEQRVTCFTSECHARCSKFPPEAALHDATTLAFDVAGTVRQIGHTDAGN
jgi:hypothetical protein